MHHTMGLKRGAKSTDFTTEWSREREYAARARWDPSGKASHGPVPGTAWSRGAGIAYRTRHWRRGEAYRERAGASPIFTHRTPSVDCRNKYNKQLYSPQKAPWLVPERRQPQNSRADAPRSSPRNSIGHPFKINCFKQPQFESVTSSPDNRVPTQTDVLVYATEED